VTGTGTTRSGNGGLAAAVVLFALALGMPVAPARAVSLVEVGGNVGAQFDGSPRVEDGGDFSESAASGDVLGKLQAFVATGPKIARTDSLAQVAHGWLRIRMRFLLEAPPDAHRHNGNAQAVARFHDEIKVMPASPALDFTMGTMTVGLLVEGSAQVEAFDVDLTGIPDHFLVSRLGLGWTLSIALGEQLGHRHVAYPVQENLEIDARSVPPQRGAAASDPAFLTVELPIRLGVPLFLTVDLQGGGGGAALAGRGSVQGRLDVSRTVEWGGIVDITDAEGQSIAYTLSSESGTDWTQPIPAPEPLALAAGLSVIGALAGLRRWRRPEGRQARRA
jgi:hypothetical protein